MNKLIGILLFSEIFFHLQSTSIIPQTLTCTLTVPIIHPQLDTSSLSSSLTSSPHPRDSFTTEDVLKQIALGLQIRRHLIRYWPQLSLLYRIKHLIHKQADYECQMGVIEKSRDAAREFIALLTPHVVSTQNNMNISLPLETLELLSTSNRRETCATIETITGKKFKSKQASYNKTLEKLQRLHRPTSIT